MEYHDLKNMIRGHLNSAAEDFFMVGYFLRQISENALFTEDGYSSIWEFAKGEYGLSASSASRFMAINARFSIDGGEHMAEKYVGMGVSKLQEMLGLPDEELEKVTQETTVRELRAMKKKQEEPLSFFGLPRTARPEGSLIDTPGCGGGKHDCFSCARPCGIRQEERHCVTAPLGNPFSCTQMGEEKRLDIEAGLFRDKCQHLHPELAPIREGDREPSPCCRDCEHKTCFSRCDVATKKDEDERKKEREELQRRQKEAEAGKPDMDQGEIESLYGWLGIRPEDEVTGAWLKERHGRSYHGGGYGGYYFTCTPRGVKTDRSREMTWGAAAKALKEVQEKKKELAELAAKSEASRRPVRTLQEAFDEEQKRKEEKAARKAAKAAEPEPEEPDIIDADFREIGDEPEPEPIQEETVPQELEPEQDPEEYGRLDVALLLDKYRRDLMAYREAFSKEDCPPPIIQKQRMIVDALALLLERMDEGGAGD